MIATHRTHVPAVLALKIHDFRNTEGLAMVQIRYRGGHTTTECLLFPDIFDRPVVAKFDQRQGSSDGGAVLLKAANQRLGLTSALAACLKEERQPGKILHEIEELLTQRVIQGGKSTKGGLR
jgi:hypothetical protein